MNKFENQLSNYACKNSEAERLKSEKEDFRPPFFHDIDRIIYSLSYTRYLDKTQVFSNNENTNISKRMIHVQLVSKTARTIGRALNLNEDLIEAIALAHDIGHTPLGHSGEKMLNDICKEFFGDGLNKTCAQHWLKINDNINTNDEMPSGDIQTLYETSLDKTLNPQMDKTTEDNLSMSLTTEDVAVEIEEEKKPDYAVKW